MIEKKMVSIIVPCYNEEDNIKEIYSALVEQLVKIEDKYAYEIIFADNGSTDGSEGIFRELSSKDKCVKVIFNQTNFGADPSVTNLYRRASGDAIIAIACDLQEPPEMIPEFIKEWENGYEVVFGQKTKSMENPFKYMCRKLYYEIIDIFSDYEQYHQITGFGLITRAVRDVILIQKKQDPGMNIRHIVGQYGFKVKLLPYTQRKRERGTSGFNMYGYYEFAISSLCRTSLKPLRLMTVLGVFTSIGCIIIALFYLIYKLTHWTSFNVGIAPLVIGLFFVSGITLFCIGILGEYVGIILGRVTDKPVVVEREALNFEEKGT